MPGFCKEERLCSTKLLDELFSGKASSFAKFPIRVVWLETTLPTPFPIQTAFSVSKKNFKKAHDRNLLKRRMREAWRLYKEPLYEHLRTLDKQYALILIYQDKVEADYKQIEKSIKKLIEKLIQS